MAGRPVTGQAFFGVPDRLATEGPTEAGRQEGRAGRLRRYCRLARDGRRALAEKAEVHAAAAHMVRARLGLTGPAAAGAAG